MLGIIATLAGCGDKVASNSATGGTTGTTTTGSSGTTGSTGTPPNVTPPNAGSTTGGKTDTPPTTADTKGQQNTPPPIPDELKNDAYSYCGLSSSKPLNMMMIGGSNTTGTLTNEFVKMKDGSAVFKQTWGGQLSTLGSGEMILKKDALYATSYQGQSVNPPQIELPGKLEIGKKWSAKYSLKGQEVSFNLKVDRFEKVTTQLGTFDSVLITAKGTEKNNGKTQATSAEIWYVKDIGEVKTHISGKDQAGKPTDVTIEAVK